MSCPAVLYAGSTGVESRVPGRGLELEARRLKSDPLMDLQQQLCPIANVRWSPVSGARCLRAGLQSSSVSAVRASVHMHSARPGGGTLERHLTSSSSSPRADHAGRRMDVASCLGRPTRMAASEGMRMTSNFRCLLPTFILLYLMNQVNSQKRGKCL